MTLKKNIRYIAINEITKIFLEKENMPLNKKNLIYLYRMIKKIPNKEKLMGEYNIKKNNKKTSKFLREKLPLIISKVKKLIKKNPQKIRISTKKAYYFESIFNLKNYSPKVIRLEKKCYYNPYFDARVEESERTLSKGEEIELFREYNFHRFKCTRVQMELNKIRGNGTSKKKKMELERLMEEQEKKIAEVGREIVSANLRFLIMRFKQILPSKEENFGNDGYYKGYNGIKEAMKKFDYRKGNRFLTYADWWIRRCFQEIPEERGVIKVPRNYELDSKEIKYLKNKGRIITSLDYNIREGDNSKCPALEIINEKQWEHAKYERDTMVKVLYSKLSKIMKEKLSKRERYILDLKFGFYDNKEGKPLSFEDISKIFNLTRERIRQIYENAVKKTKNSPKINELKGLNTYLGNILNRR